MIMAAHLAPVLEQISAFIVDMAMAFQNLSPATQEFMAWAAGLTVVLGPLIIGLGMVVGAGGTGVLRVRQGATLTLGGNLVLGALAGAGGSGQFDAGAAFSVGGGLQVGVAGQGSLDLHAVQAAGGGGASYRVQGDAMLGRHAGAAGTLTLQGPNAITAVLEIGGAMTVGNDGSGVFLHNGGGVGIGTDLTLGAGGFGNGRYEIDGSAHLRVDRHLVLGTTGQASFVQHAGEVTVAGEVALARHGQPASYQLLGGTLRAEIVLAAEEAEQKAKEKAEREEERQARARRKYAKKRQR